MTATMPSTGSTTSTGAPATPELLSVQEAYAIPATGQRGWQGVCHSLPLAEVDRLFWPEQPSHTRAYREATDQARTVCAGCAYVGDCRATLWAQGFDLGGVWFATTPAMRHTARRLGLEPTRPSHAARALDSSRTSTRLLTLLRGRGPLAAGQIADTLSIGVDAAARTAQRLVDRGLLTRDHTGRYLPADPAVRDRAAAREATR